MRRCAVIGFVLLLLASFAARAGAATEGIKVCKLLTKKEAGRILSAKVVRTEANRDNSIDAAECKYKTKKFADKDLKKFDAPILLSIDIQGIDAELRADLEERRADVDSDEITGLGDYAFRTNTGATIAVSGDIALEAGYANAGSTPSNIAEEKETAALKIAISRLPKS